MRTGMKTAMSLLLAALLVSVASFTSGRPTAWPQRSAEKAASERMISELARQQGKLSGEFRKGAGKEVVFVASENVDLPVKVMNESGIPENAYGLPVTAYLRQLDNGVQVESLKLEVSQQWAEDRSAFSSSEFSALQSAHERFDRQATSWLMSPDRSGGEEFKKAIDDVETGILDAYMQLSDDEDAKRRSLARQYRATLGTKKKAFYLHDDRYPPETYQRIFDNSKGSLGLLRGGEERPSCSGVLISNDRVLTCLHCVDGFTSNQVRVVFDYEDRVNLPPLTRRVFKVSKIVTPNSPLPDSSAKLDFALLQIEPDQEGKRPGDFYPAQCLSSAVVRRDDPLYVIGHPARYPRTVHDNSFVYYPFRASEREFAELRLKIDAEFLDAPDKPQRVKEFLNSYRETAEGGNTVYRNYSLRWGGQPTIGADCDTFHGNSGSPVYHRRTNRVVGLLFAGENDVEQPYTPGWRSHEAILPITEIIEQLDRQLTNAWRSGVCIQ